MQTCDIKIIIVDDNRVFLEGLAFYLEELLSYKIINKAYDGYEFLCLYNLHIADIILMDIEMPMLKGTEAAKKALIKNESLNIIAITNYKDKVYLTELVESGFKGCVFKSNIYDEINLAINTVLEGKLFFPETINL
ncbi:MAG: response regulator transcription factor [Chlorobi bacterium]|nr:response regulator transcription factor [Chlorobiota bacterium]